MFSLFLLLKVTVVDNQNVLTHDSRCVENADLENVDLENGDLVLLCHFVIFNETVLLKVMVMPKNYIIRKASGPMRKQTSFSKVY